MSMETHVFFRGKLPTKAALSRAMKELGFPFSITPSTGSLEQQSGFMPMKRRGEETGVEFDVYSDHAAVEEFADVGVDAGFERRASLRWGGDFQEAVAGMSAAAALAKLMNGVVFDEAEDRLLSADDAIAVARKNLQELVKPEDVKHPGTRPADLKRYLKPLLKQRSDLVLIGRLLIIRPVRHIVRGVFFDRTSDKYQFKLWLILRLLVEPGERSFCEARLISASAGYGIPSFPLCCFMSWSRTYSASSRISQSLADVDRDLGLGNEQRIAGFGTMVTALILAGRRERARELIDSFEAQPGNKERWQTWLRNQRAFLEQDAASLGDRGSVMGGESRQGPSPRRRLGAIALSHRGAGGGARAEMRRAAVSGPAVDCAAARTGQRAADAAGRDRLRQQAAPCAGAAWSWPSR